MIQTQNINDTRLSGTRGALYEMDLAGELGGGDTLEPEHWYLIVEAAERESPADDALFPLPAIPGSIFRTDRNLAALRARAAIDKSISIHVYERASAEADAIAGVIPEEAETGRPEIRHIRVFPTQNANAPATWQAFLDNAQFDTQGASLSVTRVNHRSSSNPPYYELTVRIRRDARTSTGPRATLKQGDRVKPFTIAKLCYALDISLSSTLEKIEATTQVDEAKTYIVSDRPEITGSVNGYFVDGSQAQSRLLKKFWSITTNNDGVITEEKKSSTGVVHALLSRKETEGSLSGYELWEYLPMVVDSITTDKPASGMQTFNYNFTIVGSSKPHVYRHKITAGTSA